MKPHRWVVAVAAVLAFLAVGSSSRAAGVMDSIMGKDLDSLLGKELELTGDQAKGGVGAILGLAKEKLSSADFDKISKVVPGVEKYVSKARDLGLLDKPIENKAGLDSRFTKLGIPKDKASKMVPTVTDLVGRIGGDQAKSLLTGAIG